MGDVTGSGDNRDDRSDDAEHRDAQHEHGRLLENPVNLVKDHRGALGVAEPAVGHRGGRPR